MSPFQARRAAGFSLVELLVVVAIIAILSALILPAVQAARESSRAASCRSHLQQISLATELFHDTYGAYPPARIQPRPGDPPGLDCGGKQTTWLVRILPFLEQKALEDQWDYSAPYADHPQAVREQAVAVYLCPTRRSASNAVGSGVVAATSYQTLPCGCRVPVETSGTVKLTGAVGDYGGNHGDLSPGASGQPSDFYYGGNGVGVIISSRAQCNGPFPRRWIDEISHQHVVDGLSNTFLAGEMHVPLGKLGQSPEDAFIYNGDSVFNCARVGGPTLPIVADKRSEGNGLASWGSWHPGVCNFAMADGSVRAVAATMDTDVLGKLCNRHDNQPTPAP